MNQVLGTKVLPLAPDHASALLISDLHVPADGGRAFERLRGAAALAIARRLPLLVLGDLFDSYVCRGQIRHGVWRDVAALFARVVAAGLPVYVLHGNRDFLLGSEFERASGATVIAGGLRGQLGGVDTLLLHGDELCQNDVPYQRAKRWLRSAPVRWLARHLPVRVALAAAAKARQKSQRVMQSGDARRFLPTMQAIDAAFMTGAKRLVFGHIHTPAHGAYGTGHYWVLPAFDVDGGGLLVSPAGIEPVTVADANGTCTVRPAVGALQFAQGT